MTAPDPHRSPDTQPPDEVPATGGRISQRAIIQHELIRIRRQAEAARLEAQASRLDASAEQLESLLKQIDAGTPVAATQLADLGLRESDLLAANAVPLQQPLLAPGRVSVSPEKSNPPQVERSTKAVTETPVTSKDVVRFESWEAIREAQNTSARQSRRDGAHTGVKPPHMRRHTAATAIANEADDSADEADYTTDTPESNNETRAENNADPPSESSDESPTEAAAPEPSSPPIELEVEKEGSSPPRRHRTAIITSAIIHLLLLIALAGFTLTTAMPKDQVALSASTSQPSEEAIETFQIETVQPTVDPSERTPDETQYDLDPLGEMAIVEVTSDMAPTASTPPPASAFHQPTSASDSALQAVKPDSKSKMEFCGVEGGGNHFVYLVDSSGSMGDAFISARRALLESIDMLTPEQRFYVIFFDAQCDFMRVTRADQDEPRSVKASNENKRRLKSWAMRVEMDRGRAPYEPLKYALEKLKPDVIFLLSDGEFPQGIEELIAEENRVSNLFGEIKPVSIIHTISYYSREGESRMRRIAENNFGQYRHIAKP